MTNPSDDLQVAVVTGGHPFDVRNFRHFFHNLPGITPFIQHMDDFASSPDEVRDAYDVVLLYSWLLKTPVDEGLPRFQGRPKSALERLGASARQGIFVLHHTLFAYPEWPFWSALVGIEDRRFSWSSEQSLHVHNAHPTHPVVAGIEDWDMTDESYLTSEPDADCEVLLTVDHPRSMKALAWTRQHGASRMVCLQSGHDNLAWSNPQFRQVVARGIAWCAHRI